MCKCGKLLACLLVYDFENICWKNVYFGKKRDESELQVLRIFSFFDVVVILLVGFVCSRGCNFVCILD